MNYNHYSNEELTQLLKERSDYHSELIKQYLNLIGVEYNDEIDETIMSLISSNILYLEIHHEYTKRLLQKSVRPSMWWSIFRSRIKWSYKTFSNRLKRIMTKLEN